MMRPTTLHEFLKQYEDPLLRLHAKGDEEALDLLAEIEFTTEEITTDLIRHWSSRADLLLTRTEKESS